jgi:type II secretory ATPase GspE/PulE/Tfp pilus assembly ATPase PilB-like protein
MSANHALDNFLFVLEGLAPENAVGALLNHAADLKVSDLFFCSNADGVSVSARHLGLQRQVGQLPLEQGRQAVAHVKALAGMDVAERRRPADGRWLLRRPGSSPLDLRISTVPTLYGEDLTIRLLDRDSQLLSLEKLGLSRRDYNQLLAVLNNPSGLFLVAGPTGSGKTTTLYACLCYLNNGERKIHTIEDPIEYSIEGIRQSQINPRIDVGYPELLRSVLRQAPDVIMIGEIRDPETADIAVRAANSGHLVLSTVHAPGAAGVIPSLLNLGVHPHFLANSLLGALAQRLVRTLCPHCKLVFDISDAPNSFEEVKRLLEPGQGDRLYGPKGCERCGSLGFAGRTGVFEMMSVTPPIRQMIMERQPVQSIRRKACEEGLTEFRHSAMVKVARGETCIEEVFRAIPTEYLSEAREVAPR